MVKIIGLLSGLKRQNAQSMVEYILLVTAVVVVAITYLKMSGPFKPAVENVLNLTVNRIDANKNELTFP